MATIDEIRTYLMGVLGSISGAKMGLVHDGEIAIELLEVIANRNLHRRAADEEGERRDADMRTESKNILAYETLRLWGRAGKPMRQSWLPSLFHGDEPLVVALANEICRLEAEIGREADKMTKTAISGWICRACGAGISPYAQQCPNSHYGLPGYPYKIQTVTTTVETECEDKNSDQIHR